MFDHLVEKLKDDHLELHATLVQKTSIVRTVENGKWMATVFTKDTSGTGSHEKVEELRALQKKLQQEHPMEPEAATESVAKFKFLFRQQKGDKLIPFHNIKRLGSDERITLDHRPGQILVIDLWAAWCGPCQPTMQQNQDLLVCNKDIWKGQVRIVALSMDKDETASVQRVHQKKWTDMQHLTIGTEGKHHEFCLSFGISSIPEVVLVDQAGVIVYAGHPAGWKLEQKINQLLNAESQIELAHLHNPLSPSHHQLALHPHLGQESWNKFNSVFQDPPEVNMLTNLKLVTSKTRTFKDGNIIIEVEPLMIRFKYDDTNFDHYEKVVRLISRHLSNNEYKVRSYTDNREKQLSNFYHGVREILHTNGFAGKPIVRQKRTLNICKDSDWVVTRTIGYPNISYDGNTPYHIVEKTILDLSKYHGEVKEWSATPIDGLRFVSPFTIAGHRFTNIRGLHDYANNTEASIETDHEHLQLVVSAIKHQFMERHLSNFIKFAFNHPRDVVLHIMVLGGVHLDFIEQLLKRNIENIKVYRADRSTNHDIRIMGFESYKHTVVVDRQGMVVSSGRYEDYQALDSLLKSEHSKSPTKTLTKDFLYILDNLPHSEIYKKLQEQVKGWSYTPELSIIVNDEFSSDLLHEHDRRTHNVSLKVAVREQHRQLVEPLLRLFHQEAAITVQYIATMDMPLGDKCASCQKQLVLPYYWYFTSKQHRCADCAELKSTEEISKLKRYSLLENAVLIIKDMNIDVKRLGLNIQPQTDEDCKDHSFECNGCSKDSAGEARYICMGCRREPNRRDFVDFCFQCAKNLRSGDEQKIAGVMKNCQQDGHLPNHPLLRVLYATSYNRF